MRETLAGVGKLRIFLIFLGNQAIIFFVVLARNVQRFDSKTSGEFAASARRGKFHTQLTFIGYENLPNGTKSLVK